MNEKWNWAVNFEDMPWLSFLFCCFIFSSAWRVSVFVCDWDNDLLSTTDRRKLDVKKVQFTYLLGWFRNTCGLFSINISLKILLKSVLARVVEWDWLVGFPSWCDLHGEIWTQQSYLVMDQNAPRLLRGSSHSDATNKSWKLLIYGGNMIRSVTIILLDDILSQK